ncbi:hypothetical protein SBRV1_gp54 [Sulfolobales Beppu rod-shaped virus 1]|uniref:Uncharacterized protein n=1 Tax=Sulfolobales Beppu rod-shaped virus 1 TaxID=2493121 RepID=A0A3Q8Q414_9VIRU|nr:hypothetical protein QIT32_gp54 [Sulfolobales Beppu rod-shaped virus 1]AZI75943.1 hypothetical protein SBRV1_gp54 [Sulfolobales Beppu rod-shaped virus 1]
MENETLKMIVKILEKHQNIFYHLVFANEKEIEIFLEPLLEQKQLIKLLNDIKSIIDIDNIRIYNFLDLREIQFMKEYKIVLSIMVIEKENKKYNTKIIIY